MIRRIFKPGAITVRVSTLYASQPMGDWLASNWKSFFKPVLNHLWHISRSSLSGVYSIKTRSASMFLNFTNFLQQRVWLQAMGWYVTTLSQNQNGNYSGNCRVITVQFFAAYMCLKVKGGLVIPPFSGWTNTVPICNICVVNLSQLHFDSLTFLLLKCYMN